MIVLRKKKAKAQRKTKRRALRVFSCFSGIGAFDLALQRAGHKIIGMCEIDPLARKILRRHFPKISIHKDIKKLRNLPDCDLVVAGWPCQDISQAGSTLGLSGTQSSLILELFRLISKKRNRPSYILLENVEFIVHLNKGKNLQSVVSSLNALGYRTATRVLDTQEFGLPQRRRRVFVVAALNEDPDSYLPRFCSERPPRRSLEAAHSAVGFYWTEGNTGIGWADGAIPPLKGGSGLAIPSPPAIWLREKRTFVVPTIEMAERLQGLPRGWTESAKPSLAEQRARWKLVGNAVSVPVALRIAVKLARELSPKQTGRASSNNIVQAKSPANTASKRKRSVNIVEYISSGTMPLSQRAARGVYRRLVGGRLNVPPEFLADLKAFASLP